MSDTGRILLSDLLLNAQADGLAGAIVDLEGSPLDAETQESAREIAAWMRGIIPDASEGDIQLTVRTVVMLATVRAREMKAHVTPIWDGPFPWELRT